MKVAIYAREHILKYVKSYLKIDLIRIEDVQERRQGVRISILSSVKVHLRQSVKRIGRRVSTLKAFLKWEKH